jgi:hypothetical protein
MITRDEVIWAYRLILGREPESESIIEAHCRANPDLATLRRGMLRSQEFVASTANWLAINRNAMHLDIEALFRCVVPASEIIEGPDYCTNWLGIKTDVSLFGIPADRYNVPITADTQCYEYASLLMAIDQIQDRKQFTTVEVGAAWGPWIAAAGVICRRREFQQINLVGIEADAGKCRLMENHLGRNGLLDASNVKSRLLHGAVSANDGTVYFPVIDPLVDYGAAASLSPVETDYRGMSLEHIAVPAYSLPTICEGFDIVDYMHWDIQGAEAALATASAEFLNQSVRYLFIGTHNLQIEGDLMKFFYEQQWGVLHYVPWRFRYDRSLASLEAMGWWDGEMFACNPRLT